MTEEASQIAEERKEVKSKGERERANQLDTQFQRISRRGKKAFSHEHHKERGGNNRMGKTSDLLKKTGDTKGTFHAKTAQ